MTEDSPTQRAATHNVVRRAPGKDVDDIAGAGAGGAAQPIIDTNRTGVQPHAARHTAARTMVQPATPRPAMVGAFAFLT
ncbi:MAG: hypothetical protein ABIQ97_00345 [Lysobacteraceae bacterium]